MVPEILSLISCLLVLYFVRDLFKIIIILCILSSVYNLIIRLLGYNNQSSLKFNDSPSNLKTNYKYTRINPNLNKPQTITTDNVVNTQII
jgi:multisubunit Na+/H+ antiporter MnhC subunit